MDNSAPLHAPTKYLGGRWTLLIVREIMCGSRRFNDIRRGVPRVSRTVLSERLQALVLVGALARTDGPHGPEYELTEAGQGAGDFGERPRHLGPALAQARKLRMRTSIWSPLLVDMQRRVHFPALPTQPLVVRFEIRGYRRRYMLLKKNEASHLSKATWDFPSRSACGDRWLRWLPGGAAT